jgi:hypothetical protein
MAPLTVGDVAKVLKGRGWEAEIVNQASVAPLIPVGRGGLMKCVDGRPSDHKGMNGPKALGGVYAIATNRGVRDLKGLKEIVKEVNATGMIASCHGDEHAHPAPMGCGFFKLWSQGKLDGILPPFFDSEEGKAAIVSAGGVYEQLKGTHKEKVVYINFVPETTIAPNAMSQAFVVDAWVAGKFNLDVPKYLVAAASTVEQLKGPLKAKIIAPSSMSFTEQVVKGNFPGALTNTQLISKIQNELTPHGYTPSNTLVATSLCCDEVNRALDKDLASLYGDNFSMGGLAGFPFGGITSFGAMAHHIPTNGSCLVVYGPHVGVDSDGVLW